MSGVKIFISWSGERSRLVAEALRDWLPRVIQSLKPWLSANDIEKGTRWGTDIAQQLQDSTFGIICVTSENLDARWLNFEAGALSKVISASHVCPYLLDLGPTDVAGPLSQFQSTKATREDTLKLIETINSTMKEQALTATQLKETFDVWWEKLDVLLKKVPKAEGAPPKREERDLLQETLAVVREISKGQARLMSSQHELFNRVYSIGSMMRFKPEPELSIADIVGRTDDSMPFECPNCGQVSLIRTNEFWTTMQVTCERCLTRLEIRLSGAKLKVAVKQSTDESKS
jgi:hypothetical protein